MANPNNNQGHKCPLNDRSLQLVGPYDKEKKRAPVLGFKSGFKQKDGRHVFKLTGYDIDNKAGSVEIPYMQVREVLTLIQQVAALEGHQKFKIEFNIYNPTSGKPDIKGHIYVGRDQEGFMYFAFDNPLAWGRNIMRIRFVSNYRYPVMDNEGKLADSGVMSSIYARNWADTVMREVDREYMKYWKPYVAPQQNNGGYNNNSNNSYNGGGNDNSDTFDDVLF